MTAIYNFPILRAGDTFEGTSFTLEQGGVPMDLAMAAVKVQVREKDNLSNIAWEWSTDDGSIWLVDNTINLAPRSAAQMNNTGAGIYLYDLEVTFSDGTVKTFIEGSITIKDDITK